MKLSGTIFRMKRIYFVVADIVKEIMSFRISCRTNKQLGICLIPAIFILRFYPETAPYNFMVVAACLHYRVELHILTKAV